MKTRLEQIEKKISLSKTLDLKHLIWETTLTDNTIRGLVNLGYSVEQEHFGRYYVISW